MDAESGVQREYRAHPMSVNEQVTESHHLEMLLFFDHIHCLCMHQPCYLLLAIMTEASCYHRVGKQYPSIGCPCLLESSVNLMP